MTTAGEAAALFGADDSAADPFSLGALGAEADEAGQDPFAGQELHSATDLFGSASAEDAAFTTQPEAPAEPSYEYTSTDSSWSAPQDTQYTANYSDPSHYASNQSNAYAQQPGSHDYTAQQGQWTGYEPQQYINGTYINHSSEASATYSQYAAPNAYAPPAPTSSSSYASYAPASHVTHAYDPVTPAATTQAAYDPYKPSHPSQQPSYSSTTTGGTSHSVYDPYKPSQTTLQNANAPPTTQSQFTYPQPTVSVLVPAVEPPQPPKPKVSTETYRPKTSNAYDPPIPPPKQAARRTPAPAWPAPGMSPAQTPYALPTSPPLTRGPPAAALPPPPQRPPSLPHPPPRSRSTVNDYAPPTVPPFPHSTTAPPPPRHLPHSTAPSTRSPLIKAVSPPPMSPPVRQFTPLQQVTNAYEPDVPAPYAPYQAPVSPPPPQVATEPMLPPPPRSASLQAAARPTVDEASHPEPPKDSESTVPGVERAPEAPVGKEEFDDPEGGDAFWGEDEHEAAESAPWDSTVDAHPIQPELPAAVEPSVEEHVPAEVGASHTVTSAYAPATSSPTQMKDTQPVSESTYDPYSPSRVAPPPSSGAQSPARAKSPGNASIRSWSSSQRYSLDQDRSVESVGPYAPARQGTKDSYSAAAYDPYNPSVAQRSASPSSFSVRSVGSQGAPRDPYAPPAAAGPSSIRNRSESNGSVLSHNAIPIDDPYAPSRHRQSSVESSSYRSFSALQNFPESVSSNSMGPTQIVNLSAPTHGAYAPSPSLLGTNDPLGRTSVRVPVISFGFGGKLVTCFHGSSALNTGFDIAMSSRASSIVHVRPLHTAIPQSALETSAATYPGPLFSDPGSPTTTLVRTGVSTQTKNKKARVIKYLEERAEEISQGIGYLHQGSVEGFRAEAKLAMIKLLKVMVENDGRLSGTPQIDSAVRSALLPELEATSESSTDGLHVPALVPSSFPGHGLSAPDDATITTHTLRSSQLNTIQKHLLRGDRRAAYQYAADQSLWAHAMVIASSVDKEAWKEVVTDFLRSELSPKDASGSALHASDSKGASSNGREPLKVAYSLFAGQGPASIQELLPPRPLASMSTLQIVPPVPAIATPMSASFPPPAPTMTLPKDILAKWTETAAMILGSTMTTESSLALTALGDQLAANSWIEAAHTCYLLSPQTSTLGGAGSPSGRVVLYGSPNPQTLPTFSKDPDPIIFTEIVEFALSLATPAKGQEAFAGLPHLQPYKLIRAASLAELGHVDLANRYCDAISSALTRSSPYLNAAFGEQLKGLIDQLTAAPMVDKSASWSKMTRPSLDKIGGWLERGFTNFIAGEGETPKREDTEIKDTPFSGPFTHYSTISSAASSTMPSPQMSTTNLTEMPAAPPFRTGSAMALRPSTSAATQIARASSAIDYLRRKPSPVPRISSASAMNSSFGDMHSQAQDNSPYGYGYAPPAVAPNADRGGVSTNGGVEEGGVPETPSGPQLASWWSDAPTPTASSFSHPEPTTTTATDGFISLMDDTSYTPVAPQRNGMTASSHFNDVDEDDDLGLGNASSRARSKAATPADESEAKPAAQAQKPEPPKEQEKPAAGAASGGWFSRLWKRGDTPGPVKANLGEQSSFYYDKELKRWVNKSGGADAAAAPSPPPPPPRAQTASPGSSTMRSQPIASPGPPPAHPATAIDLTDGPPKKPPMRVRSNLVPSETASAPNTPASATPSMPPRTPSSSMDPPGLDGPPPPGARSKIQGKRPARSRYVDVFQQEGTS